jgi:hypothetical protein
MRLHLLAAALALSFAPAHAQQVAVSNSSSNSSSSVNANTTSNSSAAGGSVYIAGNPSQTRAVVHSKQSGTTTIRSAPAVQAPSMGSGHPCALSGSVGISIIGGGFSGGAMKIDEACLLAQMGQGEAALIMIARRDSEACLALRSVGRIPAASRCTNAEKRAPAPAVAAVRQGPPRCPEGSRWDGRGCWRPARR